MIRERSSCAILLALLALSAPLCAETLLLRNAVVHTMSSAGTLQGADVLIRDGRIAALGPRLAAPADAQIIDAALRPITPGLFAGVNDLGVNEIQGEGPTNDSRLNLGGMHPEFDVSRAYNADAMAIAVTRIEGYTWSVVRAERGGSFVGGQGRPMALDGSHDPFFGAPLLFVDAGGDASSLSGNTRAGEWMLLEQAVTESRSAKLDLSARPHLTNAGRRSLAGYLKRRGIVVFSVDRASDILETLRFSSRHDLRAVISGGVEAWKVAPQLAKAGVPVLINGAMNLPVDFDQLGARLDNAALLHAAGVLIGFSGDRGADARRLRQGAGIAAANGLPWSAALAALTVNVANIFLLDAARGTLAVGHEADLVLWSGDPLEVTSVAEQVIIGGRLTDMASRQTRLRDRYLPPNPELPRAYLKPAAR